jgi:biopolymer transport protein ExbD
MFRSDPSSNQHDGDESSSIVPLIELLLILLLFFVVNFTTAGQSPVPLPPGPAPPEAEAHLIRLVVDIQGNVSYQGKTYVGEALVEFLRKEKPSSVLIYAHKDVPLRYEVAARQLCWKAGVDPRRIFERLENP